MLNVIDEFTRKLRAMSATGPGTMASAIRIDRKLNSTAVIDDLTDLFILRGVPGHVRSENGPEFIDRAVRDLIDAPLGILLRKTLSGRARSEDAFIKLSSPW